MMQTPKEDKSMCIDEKQAGQIIERLGNVEKATEKTVVSLYGNAKPGLMERVGKMEVTIANVYEQSKNNNLAIEKVAGQTEIAVDKAIERAEILANKAITQARLISEKTDIKSAAVIAQIAKTNQEAIDSIKTTVEELRDSMSKHYENKDLHTFRLLFKKDILTWVVIGFIILHSVLPENLSVWELIKNIFGI